MMFGWKMKTKLQNLKRKIGSDREEEARAKHDHKKGQQKKAFDERQKSKEKKLNKGDEVDSRSTPASGPRGGATPSWT